MVLTEANRFTFTATGHPNIQATHKSTFEVTMAPDLSLQGDCIIGVNASHSAQQINSLLGDALRHPKSHLLTYLSNGPITECIQGYGSPQLILQSPTSLVWRTSDYVDDRTIAIRCNKAARDLNRRLIESLQQPDSTLQVTLVLFLGTT
ncbi:MAG: DUF371 domain-containing protein [Promethearchaeota archaeon]